MTVRELSKFTGKTERTIRNWIKKAGEKMSSVEEKNSNAGHGKVVDYTIDEVECILQCSSMSRDAVSILMENARKNTNPIPIISQTSSTLTERDIELISKVVSVTVAKTIEELDKRMNKIESRIDERQALLPPMKKDARSHINELVRNYANAHNMQYSKVFNMLYKEYGYRTHTNPSISAKNSNMTVIAYIEKQDKIELLESIAMDFLSN